MTYFSISGRFSSSFWLAFLLALLPMGKWWYGWWFWAVLLFLFARRHPPVPDESHIGSQRIRLGVLGLVIFLLCFSVAPIIG